MKSGFRLLLQNKGYLSWRLQLILPCVNYQFGLFIFLSAAQF